jgi:hypothetical protein
MAYRETAMRTMPIVDWQQAPNALGFDRSVENLSGERGSADQRASPARTRFPLRSHRDRRKTHRVRRARIPRGYGSCHRLPEWLPMRERCQLSDTVETRSVRRRQPCRLGAACARRPARPDCPELGPSRWRAQRRTRTHLRFVDFFPPEVLRATAARMSALNAFASISSPS